MKRPKLSPKLSPMLSRRQFFAGAAAGGGLLLAWWAWPRSYDPALTPSENEHGFGAWLTISEDSVVSIAVPQLEMGQGITTLLPQIIALEMGADWRQIAVVPTPPSGTQPNTALAAKWAPLWSEVQSVLPSLVDEGDDWLAQRFAQSSRFSATADGTSLSAYEDDARAGGASARAMLAMAAGDLWGVSWEECIVSAGLVRHGDKQLRFGDLAKAAAKMDPPDPPPLRPNPPQQSPLGQDADTAPAFPRLDLPAKVDGTLLFAGDVRLPGMVHASIRHGPIGKPELANFDEAAAARVAGLLSVVKSKRWIACIAESWWQADKACTALRAQFAGEEAVSSVSIAETLDDALSDGEAVAIAGRGEGHVFDEKPTLESRFSIAPQHHGSIETASATAHLADGKLHLWIAAQAPEHAREAAAKAIGMNVRDVVLYPVPAGGSFDARLEKQHAIEVAQIAKETGRPVQLTWSRAEETASVPPRAPVAIALSTKLSAGAERKPVSWKARIACPSTALEFGARLFDNATPEAAIAAAAGKADALACEGTMPLYAVPNVAIEHVPTKLDLPTGRLRGNAWGYTGFATESFIDEIAQALGQDPMLYRMTLLGEDQRMVIALRRAAQLAGWDGGREGTGQGIAIARMQTSAAPSANGALAEGRIACVVKARLGAGGVVATEMQAVVDIGRIVNLDIARQQIEGGLLFGLGLATGSSAVWENGRPQPSSLAGLNVPSLADAPQIEVDFIASDAPPFDPGELGAVVAPPAIANALFAATGTRYRNLPLLDPVGRDGADDEELAVVEPLKDPADAAAETGSPSEAPTSETAPNEAVTIDAPIEPLTIQTEQP